MSDLSLCLGDVAFAIARAPSSRRTGPRYRLAQSSWLELCSDQASYEIPAERSSSFNLRSLHGAFHAINKFLVLFAARVVKSRAENRDNFQHILGQSSSNELSELD